MVVQQAMRLMAARTALVSGVGARFLATGAPSTVLVSLAGKDRVGIVKDFSNSLAKAHGNMEESRMALLGGEFAMIALISMKSAELSAFHSELKSTFPDFSLAIRETEELPTEKTQEFVLEIDGPDSKGIVAHISETLAKKGASIKSMETETVPAPFAGFDLFRMKAIVECHPSELAELQEGVEHAGEKFGLDIASLKESSKE